MKDFEDGLREARKRRMPVRYAVREHWPIITKARSDGEPLDAIFRALKQAGQAVGKGPSSFRAAVKFWDRHDAENAGVTPTAPQVRQGESSFEQRSRFSDNRFKPDF